LLATGKRSGFRNDPSGRFTHRRYDSMGEMRRAGHPPTDHQVFLAHGGIVLVDEQFVFADPEDARWFCEEGYRRMLYLREPEFTGALHRAQGDEPNYGIDRMHLWINGKEVNE
jgi:hypothetical protein